MLLFLSSLEKNGTKLKRGVITHVFMQTMTRGYQIWIKYYHVTFILIAVQLESVNSLLFISNLNSLLNLHIRSGYALHKSDSGKIVFLNECEFFRKHKRRRRKFHRNKKETRSGFPQDNTRKYVQSKHKIMHEF